MPTGYLRISGESLVGNEVNTPTLSTKKVFPPIQSFGFHPGVAPLSRDDELRNQDEPLAVIPESYNPTWDMALRAYPDSLGIILKLLLGAPTTVTGNGVVTDLGSVVIPTGAYKHTWTAPFGPTGQSPLTAQLDAAYSDQSVFYKVKGAAASDLTIETPEAGGATVSCSGVAAYAARQSDPSLSPSYEALTVPPFTRNNLTLPTNLSGTGETQDFTVSINNPVEAVRTLGIASRWPDNVEKANAGPIVVSGSIPKRVLDADDYDALIANTGFALTAQWVSTVNIASSYPYKLFMTASNCQFIDGEPDALQNQRRHGQSLSWKSTSPSAGSTVFQLVNATSSYA